MGRIGTEVACEAADMVLLDDNFATIVAAVREGRRVYDNIRKFVKYALTTNLGELWTLLLAPFLGLPLPLLPLQILWVNLVTDGLPGLAFGFEPQEQDVMQHPPRRPDESIFAHGLGSYVLWVGLLIGIVCLLTLFWAYFKQIAVWQTLVFTLLVFCQFANALVIRSERELLWQQGLFSNLPLLGAVVIGILLQLAVIYLPFLNGIFETRPLPAALLGVCVLLPLVIMAAVEAEKWLARQGLIYAPLTPEAQSRRFRVRAFALVLCRWLVFLTALFYSVPADGKLR